MKWPELTLATVAEINPRRSHTEEINDDLQVTFVPMSAVSETFATIEKAEIRIYQEVKKGFTYFEENDVLFAKITPCMENGKSALAINLLNGIGFGSTEFHVLRANRKVIFPEFLHYFIRQQSFRDLAKSGMRGAVGQQRVPKDFLENVTIPLPPLSEQRRIVEILDQADALRKKRAEADAKASRILRALFYKMFGDPVTNPKGWKICTLGDVILETQYGTSIRANTEDKGVPILRMNNIDYEGSLYRTKKYGYPVPSHGSGRRSGTHRSTRR